LHYWRLPTKCWAIIGALMMATCRRRCQNVALTIVSVITQPFTWPLVCSYSLQVHSNLALIIHGMGAFYIILLIIVASVTIPIGYLLYIKE
jgi:uncharacterized membrane protein